MGDPLNKDDRNYYRRRAEAELEAAERATDPKAARAHFLLAGYYLDLAYNADAELAVIVGASPRTAIPADTEAPSWQTASRGERRSGLDEARVQAAG
jgi:hypothetical protein